MPGAARARGGLRHAGRSSAPTRSLAENRFLAARDGIEAELLDPDTGRRAAGRARCSPSSLDAVHPHADALGGATRLALLEHDEPGYARQRAVAARAGGPRAVVADLAARFGPTED